MWVITMLGRSPKNGAEIMQEIENLTQGWWRPSPGSVYPLLDELTQEGTIRKREDGKYELTPQGKEQVQWPFSFGPKRPQTVDDMLNEINGYVSYLEDIARTDKTKMSPYGQKIKNITERLESLT